ncbi:MAG: hypothetical protein ABJE66_04325 [Deltaproteobacteria bacterium]
MSPEHATATLPQCGCLKKALLLCVLACAACDDHGDAPWTEPVADHANLTLLHESDATGDWVTLLDEHHVELCMFSVESTERLDFDFIEHVCGFI